MPEISTDIANQSAPLTYGVRIAVIAGPDRGLKVSVGRAPIRVGSAPDSDLVLDDRQVSRHHLQLTSHPAGVRVRDLGSSNGTFLGEIKIADAVAPPGSVIKVGQSELLIEPDQSAPEIPLTNAIRLGALIGRSPAMRRLFTVIERVAPTDYTVLTEGETGTGKEVLARTIHELSPRGSGPFVVFDCAAVMDTLLESELFGHVRGAFTGAISAREGAFRRATGGTLFIDELNSLSLSLQGKLLRALESRRIHPVGADHELDVDVRIVAATNRALADELKAGRFREDLYFRMSVIRISLPPLRDRREDIPMLAEHFLRAAGFMGEIGGPNLDRLVGYSWPGNVRELRNALERAMALAGTRQVPFSALPIQVGDTTPTLAWPISLETPFKEAKEQLLDMFERVYASHLLDRSRGNISEAARRAGLSRRHFFALLKKHALLRPGDKESEE